MQAFGHDISELVRRGNMKNSNMSQTDLLTDEVDVDPDVLGAAMMDRIGHHVDSANIVAIDNHRSSNRDMKLLKKLTKPTTLGNSMGHSLLLRLSIRARDCGMSLSDQDTRLSPRNM